MAKFIAMLMAFAVCTAAGCKSAGTLRLRARVLKAMSTAIQRFMLSMEYEKKPLALLAKQRIYGDAQPFFDAYGCALSEGMSPVSAWETALCTAERSDRMFSTLTDADRKLLRSFSENLGASDLKTQRRSADLVLARLSELNAQADADFAAKGRVYRTMGMLCGAAVAILML